jgi:hypothetical protein
MLTLALLSLLAATPDHGTCRADIARARLSVAQAAWAQRACFDPDECRVARELGKAARAQQDATEALCPVPESTPDPFESTEVPTDEGDAEAWLLMDALVADVNERLEAVTRP